MNGQNEVEDRIKRARFPVARDEFKAALREAALTGEAQRLRAPVATRRSSGTWLALAWSAIAACALVGVITWQSLQDNAPLPPRMSGAAHWADGGAEESGAYPPSFARGDAGRSGFFAKALARNDGREKLLLVADGAVRALSTADGTELWNYPVEGECAALGIKIGMVLLVDQIFNENKTGRRPVLAALDAADGKVKYRHDPWGGAEGIDCVVQRVIFSRRTAFLTMMRSVPEAALVMAAVDAVTGEVLWERVVDGALQCTNLAVADGKLMASFDAGWFAAMNPLSGAELWRFEAPQQTPLWDFTVAGKLVVLAGTSDVFGLASDGRELWRLYDDPKGAAPAVRKGRGWFVTAGNALVELNAVTGAVAWRRDFAEDANLGAAPVLSGDVALCMLEREPDAPATVKAFASDSRKTLWETRTLAPEDCAGWSAVESRELATAPGAVFAAYSEPLLPAQAARGWLVKLDLQSGDVLWRMPMNSLGAVSPLVVR